MSAAAKQIDRATGGGAQPLVTVRGLRVHFPGEGGTVRAVDNVDLDITRGETLALVGESGCGKSTLARAIVGLQETTTGSLSYAGQPLEPLGHPSRQRLCRDIQMVFQDPESSLNPRMTLASAIAEPLVIHGGIVDSNGASTAQGKKLSGKQIDEQVCELLQRVGIDPSFRNRYAHELSGGQRQRICVARALAVKPDFIVCDEAVSALDVSVQAQILNLLRDLQDQFDLTYLFITHDLGVVRHIADRVAVMYLGEIVEEAATEDIFEDAAHPYTQALLAAVPSLAPGEGWKAPARGDLPSAVSPPSGCRFHPRCPHVMARCKREAPPLVPLKRRPGEAACWLLDETRSAAASSATAADVE